MSEGIKLHLGEPTDDFNSPLVRFKGICKAQTIVQKEAEENRRASTSLKLDFVDVTVIESTEPYPFPIASFTIPYSERGETRWAAFTSSLRKIVPPDLIATGSLDFLVGKEQEWHFTGARLRLPVRDENNEVKLDASGKQVWGVQEGKAWQILNLEGFGQAEQGNILDTIRDWIGEGKKDQEIYQYVFTEQKLKSFKDYNQTVEAVASRKLIESMTLMGMVKVEGELVKAV